MASSCPGFTRPARWPASRCTGPTGWPQFAAGDHRLRSARRAPRPPHTPARRRPNRAARPAAASRRAAARSAARIRRDPSASAPIRAALQQTMDDNASVFAAKTTLKQAAADIARAQGALPAGRRSPITGSATTPNCSRRSNWASCSTWPRCWSRRGGAYESRGGHFREDFPTRDDVNFMRHTMAYRVGPMDEQIELGTGPWTSRASAADGTDY